VVEEFFRKTAAVIVSRAQKTNCPDAHFIAAKLQALKRRCKTHPAAPPSTLIVVRNFAIWASPDKSQISKLETLITLGLRQADKPHLTCTCTELH
jgi:hypothetical protein